jgi:2'-5' RNA ligase
MEAASVRLFVAVSIPRPHLERVDDEMRSFRDKAVNARWIDLENQHVTLKFLGRTPSDRLADVERVCAMVAASHRPAPVSVIGTGAFPSRSRVRVLWIGLDDPEGVLTRMAGDLDQAFEPLGFATEARSFTPHLTLCRFKIPVPLKGGFPEADLSDLEPFSIDRLELYRSHLSPKGATYEHVGEFPLMAG